MLTALLRTIPLLVGLSFVPLLSAQQSPSAAPSGNPISLDVVVTPKSGPPVSGLEQKDFTVLDNKAEQPVTSFRAYSAPDAPLEVVLLIDAVNTDYTTIAFERSEIDKFLRADGGKLAHGLALAIFTDDGVRMQSAFSRNGNAIADSLDRETVALRAIRRSAGFYGAEDRLDISLHALQQLATNEAAHPGRKLILWVSPGWPLLTGPSVQLDGKQQQRIFASIVEASRQLRQANITIYNINPLGASEDSLRVFYYEQFLKGVTKPSQVNLGNLSLQVLAVQTGGLVLNSSNDVSALLRQAFQDADAWYEISFQSPSGEPNEYHQIQVRVDKPGLIARTRTGYYAQP